jgi:hypothetical protein
MRPTDIAGALSMSGLRCTIFARVSEVGCTPFRAGAVIAVLEIAVLEPCRRSSHACTPSQLRSSLVGTALRTHQMQTG